MDIIRVDLSNKKQVRDFMDLPFRIYSHTPQWVPALVSDVRLMLDPKMHPFYRHSQAAFFLAHEKGQPVGRIAVLNNRRYNVFNRESTAFFYLFECENNNQAAHGLFDAALEWAGAQGLTKMVGPRGFTVMDGFGLLVKGFDHRPAFGLPYNLSYYPELVEASGFEPEHDSVSGYLGRDIQFPERIHELSERIQMRRGLHIAHYKTRRELRALMPHLKELYNGALEGTEGNVPLTDEEVHTLAAQLLWFADPKLIKIVMKEEKPVGFLLAYPDISAALQKTRGRLFPFGWLTMLLELKSTDWVNINGMGLLEEYRGSGGTAVLFSEMFKSVRDSGQFSHADIVQIGTENEKMLREMNNFGIDFYKIHRTYKKIL